MTKKILIATHNQAKLKEIKIGLKPLLNYNFALISLNDVGEEKAPKETGRNFRENAQIKAIYYGKKTKLMTIADDGGLIIPYLNNQPGVYSRRWPGYQATDQELINYTLEKIKKLTKKQRIAYLETCICFFHPEKNQFLFQEEKIKGYLAKKISTQPEPGYPFRALFIIDKFNKFYDELTEKEHQQINHRLKAIKKLLPKILKITKPLKI